jgi:hypothetical protein
MFLLYVEQQQNSQLSHVCIPLTGNQRDILYILFSNIFIAFPFLFSIGRISLGENICMRNKSSSYNASAFNIIM